MQAKYAQILSAFVLSEDGLEQGCSALDVQPRGELIDAVLEGVAVHGSKGLGDSGDDQCLLAQDPLHPQSLVWVLDEDILMDDI